ncbi:MAG: hypothetical protein HKN13_13435 [Rhodothermales bacterium]|nr:hypothetical protein [Rhodothermales bacterium]
MTLQVIAMRAFESWSFGTLLRLSGGGHYERVSEFASSTLGKLSKKDLYELPRYD